MKADYPAFFARFYDTIYASIRDSVDHTYYLDKMISTRGRVLEIGTGTGRLFLDALNRGVDIYGLDLNESMLQVLKSKLPADQLYRVSTANAIDFSHTIRYSLILAPFRVFSHIREPENQIAALNNIYDHLEESGCFIFDLFVPDLKLLLDGLDNVVDFEGEYESGEKLKRTCSMSSDLVNQLSHITFKLDWTSAGKEYSESWDFDFRFYFRYELEHLLSRTKFNKYCTYGNFSEEPLNPGSKEFIVKCTK
jgi:SAM-dependent methyltransferase